MAFMSEPSEPITALIKGGILCNIGQQTSPDMEKVRSEPAYNEAAQSGSHDCFNI
jgi:hypothetical protein